MTKKQIILLKSNLLTAFPVNKAPQLIPPYTVYLCKAKEKGALTELDGMVIGIASCKKTAWATSNNPEACITLADYNSLRERDNLEVFLFINKVQWLEEPIQLSKPFNGMGWLYTTNLEEEDDGTIQSAD